MPVDVLFDLDGTLTDSAPGIVASVEHALREVGVESPGRHLLRSFVGPPMQQSLRQVLRLDEVTVERAFAAYREYFVAKGMWENSLYGGVADLLGSVRALGSRVALATSKPTVFAEQILEHFEIRQHFDVVCGADLDGRRAGKAGIVADALAALGDLAPGGAVMVGDRQHDVEGAKANGLGCIGAAWGYAAPGELEGAGAAPIVGSVPDLEALLTAW